MRDRSVSSLAAEITPAQRWGTYLCILLTVGMLAVGFNLRSSIVDATRRFESPEVGISVRYPASWLIDQSSPQYVVRLQDPVAIPYKTSITIRILPRGETPSAEEVLRDLSLRRSRQVAPYRSLGIEPIRLGSGLEGRQQTYAFAEVEKNPFLQSEPIIVRAVDVVFLRGSQALVITFETDAQSYESNRRYFEAFLATLSI
jgi:hypothetical protein